MRRALLTGPWQIELVDESIRPPKAAEVRLRVQECGICASDVDLWAGRGQERFPVAIGHEVAGAVEEVGAGANGIRVGDTVAAWVEGGGFAEYVSVEERLCVPVDESVRYAAVAEPLACIINAVELAAPALGADVTIVGAGYMGNLLQLVSLLKGPRSLTMIDVRSDALERARQLGTTATVNSKGRTPREVANEIAPADLTYEVTGTQGGLELASALTRMGGKLCIVGYHLGGARTVPLGYWNWMAFELINAHFRDREVIMRGMRAGLALVNAGRLNVAPLVTHTATLERISDAFQLASQKPAGFCKAVIRP